MKTTTKTTATGAALSLALFFILTGSGTALGFTGQGGGDDQTYFFIGGSGGNGGQLTGLAEGSRNGTGVIGDTVDGAGTGTLLGGQIDGGGEEQGRVTNGGFGFGGGGYTGTNFFGGVGGTDGFFPEDGSGAGGQGGSQGGSQGILGGGNLGGPNGGDGF